MDMRSLPVRSINDVWEEAWLTGMTPQTTLSGTEAGPRAKLPTVPDLDHRRFCRACQAVLPLDAFPAGKRRYLCRKHMWERVKRPHKERLRSDPRKKQICRLWKQCWDDARRTFQQTRVVLTQGDIAAVLSMIDVDALKKDAKMGASGTDAARTDAARTDASKQMLAGIALLPANPTQRLSNENHVVVDAGTRLELLRAFRKEGVGTYVEALERLD